MITKEQKQATVAELVEKLQGASSLYFIDFTGMTVALDQAFRKELREYLLLSREQQVDPLTAGDLRVKVEVARHLADHLAQPAAIRLIAAETSRGSSGMPGAS